MEKVKTLRFPLTVAAVPQVGPDDVLLGEAEDAEPASSHRGVYDDAGVCHHLRALIETDSAATAEGSKSKGKITSVELV